MVEKIPFSVVLHDGVMCCPADNGFKDASAVGEGTCGALARSIYDIVSRSGGI